MLFTRKYLGTIPLVKLYTLTICAILFSWGIIFGAYAQIRNIPRQDPGVRGASVQPGLASKKILILHPYEYAMPANRTLDQSLKELFLGNGIDGNSLFFEFMGVARNLGQEFRNRLSEFLRNIQRSAE